MGRATRKGRCLNYARAYWIRALPCREKSADINAYIVAIVWIYRRRIPVYANSIMRGDRDAIRRIIWFVRHFVFGFVFGRLPIGLPNISDAKRGSRTINDRLHIWLEGP